MENSQQYKKEPLKISKCDKNIPSANAKYFMIKLTDTYGIVCTKIYPIEHPTQKSSRCDQRFISIEN